MYFMVPSLQESMTRVWKFHERPKTLAIQTGWSVLPSHLTLNEIVSSRGFDAVKLRTAVKEGNGCANSRLARRS